MSSVSDAVWLWYFSRLVCMERLNTLHTFRVLFGWNGYMKCPWKWVLLWTLKCISLFCIKKFFKKFLFYFKIYSTMIKWKEANLTSKATKRSGTYYQILFMDHISWCSKIVSSPWWQTFFLQAQLSSVQQLQILVRWMGMAFVGPGKSLCFDL